MSMSYRPARNASAAFWGRLNRAFCAVFGLTVVSEGAVETLAARLDNVRCQLDELIQQQLNARVGEIANQVGTFSEIWKAAFPVSREELHYLDRFRMERRLLAGWDRERGELVARVHALLSQLRPMRVVGETKARFGSRNDGGYVMMNRFEGVDTAISLGVERNADWDLAMVERGMEVLQFDHTIDHPPVNHPRITWRQKKIAPTASDSTESIVSILESLDRDKDAPNVVLKIDIEHDEWPVLDATPSESLSRFAQITGEFHGFDYLADRGNLELKERVIQKLIKNFAVVHVHANNHCGVANYFGLSVPYILELTLVNKKLHQFDTCEETFPGALDAPCDPSNPDIVLGSFHY